MYLYTYYTKAAAIITDASIYYVEIYIYIDGNCCIYGNVDIYCFVEKNKTEVYYYEIINYQKAHSGYNSTLSLHFNGRLLREFTG